MATTRDGDIPLFLRPLDGNSSDKATLLAAVISLQDQLREADGEPSVYVAEKPERIIALPFDHGIVPAGLSVSGISAADAPG